MPASVERNRPSRFCRLLWLIGLVGLPFGHWALFARVEPFHTAVYTFLWWPFIFSVDLAVYLLRGRSLLSERPREFLLLTLWSTPVWLLFEALNLRLENWYYVQVPHIRTGNVLLAFSYATVLPGVFEVAELIVAAIERAVPGGRISGRPFRITRRVLIVHVLIGAAMLILPMAWPFYFFCLIWGFAFFLLEPICYARGGPSLLRQMASGDNTRLVALLLSGFLCGGLWEAWNIHAHAKWIYTVPGFEQFKLGEMPLLGFLGFPPFVLECYAIVNFISLWRGGRHWEIAPATNARLPGIPRQAARRAWAIVIVLSFATVGAIFPLTVSSWHLPLKHYDVIRKRASSNDFERMERAGVRYAHQIRSLDQPPDGVNPAAFEEMQAIARLSEIKGMGVRFAGILYDELGIQAPSDLATWNAGKLAAALRERLGPSWHGGERRQPSAARVRVWIVDAHEMEHRSRDRP